VWFVYLYLGPCALWVQEQVTRKGLMTAMEIKGSWDPGIGSGLWSGSVGKYFLLKDEEKEVVGANCLGNLGQRPIDFDKYEVCIEPNRAERGNVNIAVKAKADHTMCVSSETLVARY
jgi:hypothetical protein